MIICFIKYQKKFFFFQKQKNILPSSISYKNIRRNKYEHHNYRNNSIDSNSLSPLMTRNVIDNTINIDSPLIGLEK